MAHRCYGRNNVSRNRLTTSGLQIVLNGVISLPDATSYDNYMYRICAKQFFKRTCTENSILLDKRPNLCLIFVYINALLARTASRRHCRNCACENAPLSLILISCRLCVNRNLMMWLNYSQNKWIFYNWKPTSV